MTIGTGDRAPEFDLDEDDGRPRVRLSNYLGRANVLLVFHPFAFTEVCAEEAMDLARAQVEVDVVVGDHAREALDDRPHLDREGGVGHASRPDPGSLARVQAP